MTGLPCFLTRGRRTEVIGNILRVDPVKEYPVTIPLPSSSVSGFLLLQIQLENYQC